MLSGTYRDLLPAIAGCAATLTGLLFVAITLVDRRSPSAEHPAVLEQTRAAASILTFTNALTVSLFALVPGNNTGYPATVMAVVGIIYTAAGTRSILASPLMRRHMLRQLELIAVLAAAFALELASGIYLVVHPRSTGAAELVSNLLVAFLIIGIARAWELTGNRHTGPVTSISVLTGHDPNPDVASDLPAPDADLSPLPPLTAVTKTMTDPRTGVGPDRSDGS
ncbi:MAG TPA: hypothetical protein VK817_08795 [Trebonia sp.]|nr:hypothetical protein [Trebonia sp.]